MSCFLNKAKIYFLINKKNLFSGKGKNASRSEKGSSALLSLDNLAASVGSNSDNSETQSVLGKLRKNNNECSNWVPHWSWIDSYTINGININQGIHVE